MKRIVKSNTNPTSQAEIDKFYNRKFNLTQALFDKQLAFVEDESPYKIAVCSRRSGKTTACAAHMVSVAISTPDVNMLYITLTRDTAKRLVWKELRRINKEHDLKAKENETELTMTFPNGSVIYLSGCKDSSEIEKFRGMAIKLCYVDECQSFREYIRELIDDIIAPALLDYAGSLCLIGTPGPIPTGFFHECAVKSDTWSKHGWTLWDNPFLPLKSGVTQQKLLERELKRRGVLESDPGIQREFYGKWMLDSDSLLIHYDATKNTYSDLLPGVKYEYIMGIDIGYKDADAICILAWSEHDPVTYLVEELINVKQGVTELVLQIQELDKKYKVSKMVMDFGGLGKKIGEEMIRRHSIPVEAAEKTRKMENIAFLNDALRSGRFKAKSNSRFAQDSYMVEIDRDKSTPERIAVSSRYHSDIIDAVLYAFKLSPAFSYEPPQAKLIPGTKAWAEAQSSTMWEAELAGRQKDLEADNSYNKWLLGDD